MGNDGILRKKKNRRNLTDRVIKDAGKNSVYLARESTAPKFKNKDFFVDLDRSCKGQIAVSRKSAKILIKEAMALHVKNVLYSPDLDSNLRVAYVALKG